MEKIVKAEGFLTFIQNKKPNASLGTFKLDLSHKHCVTTVRRIKKVYIKEIQSYNVPSTLTSTGRSKMHKYQKYRQHPPTKKKESVPDLSDSQACLHEEQSRI